VCGDMFLSGQCLDAVGWVIGRASSLHASLWGHMTTTDLTLTDLVQVEDITGPESDGLRSGPDSA